MLMVTLAAPPPGDGLVGVEGLSLPPPPHPAEATAITSSAHPQTVSLDIDFFLPGARD
jgi:hypothetical protein